MGAVGGKGHRHRGASIDLAFQLQLSIMGKCLRIFYFLRFTTPRGLAKTAASP
jgi:hypothetical protein